MPSFRIDWGAMTAHLSAIVDYMQFPTHSEYGAAVSTAASDGLQACRSSSHLFGLTLRPLLLGSWLLSQYTWVFAKFVGKQLFAGAYVSGLKGWEQTKWIGKKALEWQLSLSREQVYMEIGAFAILAILIVSFRHIQQQKYYERTRRFYMRQRRKVTKVSLI